MEITFRSTTLAGAPALIATGPAAGAPRPAVLWFHGFGADKDVHRPELETLARAGFCAVGIDAVGHGQRRSPDLSARQAAPRAEAHRAAVEYALSTAREVPHILRALSVDARPPVVGAVGISMGAYILYRSVVEEPAIRAAVAILGSPEWPHPESPHSHIDAFAATSLLSITAERDENVPPAPARDLHRRLAESFPTADQRYLELANGVHLMSEEHWHLTMRSTIEWLQQRLLAAR